MIQDTVVIGGECSLETRIEGDCDLTSMVEGDPGVLVVEGGGQTYPHYSGSYVVTPSASQQVLQTDGKVMDDDVTVEAVAQGSATTPATIINASPTISVDSATGQISATISTTQQITPTVQEGYVSQGTPGNVGVSGLAIQTQTTQGAQTIHPASNDQIIAKEQYLTGNQTIKAVTVTGLTADKILQGNVIKIGDADDDDRIMSVTGTASGGSGLTTVASGTYTGTGGYPSSAGTGFFIGTKMPKTDFWVKFVAQSDSEFTYNTDYKHAYGMAIVPSDIGHFDLSSVADSIQMTSDISFDINNSGTVTSTAAGTPIVFMDNVRNATAKNTNMPNNFKIDRRSDGFYVRFYNSNSAYKYVSGMKYDWEVVYFGSNPSTDIIEV